MHLNRPVITRALWLLAVLVTAGPVHAEVPTPEPTTDSVTADPVETPYGVVEIAITEGLTVENPGREGQQRSAISFSLHGLPRSIAIDVAELILSVSTVYDTTFEDSIAPLIVAAYPALESASEVSGRWSGDWNDEPEGYDPDLLTISSVNSSESDSEIRLEITDFVRRWASGELANHGIVIRALSEGRSTYRWIRDGRYDGADAMIRIWYSRLE